MTTREKQPVPISGAEYFSIESSPSLASRPARRSPSRARKRAVEITTPQRRQRERDLPLFPQRRSPPPPHQRNLPTTPCPDPPSARLPGYAPRGRAVGRLRFETPQNPAGKKPPAARTHAPARPHLSLPHGASPHPTLCFHCFHPPADATPTPQLHPPPASATSPHRLHHTASDHGLPLYHHASNLRHA